MKKILSSLLLFFIAITFFSCGKENIVTFNDLPSKSQQFINQYFSNIDISYIIKDYDSYDVKFVNGYEVDFTKKGDWKEVDCQIDAVPMGIIPTNIITYVTTNFPNNFIVQISLDRHGYDVELNNGLDLIFDKHGNYKRVDD